MISNRPRDGGRGLSQGIGVFVNSRSIRSLIRNSEGGACEGYRWTLKVPYLGRKVAIELLGFGGGAASLAEGFDADGKDAGGDGKGQLIAGSDGA